MSRDSLEKHDRKKTLIGKKPLNLSEKPSPDKNCPATELPLTSDQQKRDQCRRDTSLVTPVLGEFTLTGAQSRTVTTWRIGLWLYKLDK